MRQQTKHSNFGDHKIMQHARLVLVFAQACDCAGDGGIVGLRVIVGMGLEVGVGVGRSRRGRLCDLRGVSELQQP